LGQQYPQVCPFFIRQITGVGFSLVHALSLLQVISFCKHALRACFRYVMSCYLE
jgi:uncharacterized membrane protein